LRPRVHDLGYRQPRYGENVDGLRDRVAQGADLLDGSQPRRIQDVGAGLLERLEPPDRVGKVGVVADVVLRTGGEREREGHPTGGLDGGADSLRRVADLVELTALPVESSIEPPTAPALATRRIASAASAGLGP